MTVAPYRRRVLRAAAGLFAAGCLAWWQRGAMASSPRQVALGTPPPSSSDKAIAAELADAMNVSEVNRCLPEDLVARLWPDPVKVRFAPTSLEERRAFSRLMPGLLAAARVQSQPPAEYVVLAATVGFLLESYTLDREIFWILREDPARLHGAGAYLLRTGEASHDFVQAPHHYFDLGTGPLGLSMFACAPAGQKPRLFATNTAHRYMSREGEKRSDADHPADLAHNPDHLFQLVTDLAARAMPNLRVFQVHGFGKKREARAAVAAIISGGTRSPSVCARKVAGRLGRVLGGGVRLYPEQFNQLGGTRNAQARLLQAYPGTRFVHLELSPKTRQALGSPEQLRKVTAALFQPEEDG